MHLFTWWHRLINYMMAPYSALITLPCPALPCPTTPSTPLYLIPPYANYPTLPCRTVLCRTAPYRTMAGHMFELCMCWRTMAGPYTFIKWLQKASLYCACVGHMFNEYVAIFQSQPQTNNIIPLASNQLIIGALTSWQWLIQPVDIGCFSTSRQWLFEPVDSGWPQCMAAERSLALNSVH